MGAQKIKHSRLRQEIAALFILFLAIFLFACLISYSQVLVGKDAADAAGGPTPESNWCGSVGYFTAYYLFSFFGLSAFVPVLLLVVLASSIFFSEGPQNRIHYIMAGITGILISVSGLFSLVEKIYFPPEFIKPGGYLGSLVQVFLGKVVGPVGLVLVLVLLLVLSLMATVRFSLAMTLKLFWIGGRKMAGGVYGQASRIASIKKKSEKVVSRTTQPSVTREKEFIPTVHEPIKVEPDVDSQDSQDRGFDLKPLEHSDYQLPPITLLDRHKQAKIEVNKQHYYEVSKALTDKLLDFNVEGTVQGISPGPVVTTYEFSPAPGIKINRIVALADDLAMVLKVERVRIVGSVPGKAAIGIEIPNPVRNTVYLRDILMSDEYTHSKSKLSLALGLDVVGRPVVADLARMPHLLIAGATGAGKSVAINSFIASFLFKATPDEVRLLMIDPKRIELSVYEDIPHLLHPVVVEPTMASRALIWAVKEMERRYRLLEEKRVKSFVSYNEVVEEKLPYIVIIVDELADLMMVASKDVETSIARLAQMARAAGMHIILATQRPSVDVLTGLIKANFPTRISFKVSSKVDSRTIIDSSGAEHLLGSGDMLFLPPGAAKLQRIHGAYIDESEAERIITFLKRQGKAEYDDSVIQDMEERTDENGSEPLDYDEKYDEAVAIVCETGQASISMVQRRLRVGYNRAARMIETMEKEGIVGPSDGSRPREVIARSTYKD